MRMEPIPNYGDHMTIFHFVGLCKSGTLIDDDGSASLATETEMSTEDVETSLFSSDNRTVDEIVESYRLQGWTHVVWFNR